MFILTRLISIVFFLSASLSYSNESDFLIEVSKKVDQAILSLNDWNGPTSGPPLIGDKHIIFVASDLRNDGVYYLAQGVSEAIENTNWNLSFVDGSGSEVRQGALIRKAMSYLPDGIVLGGIDASRHQSTLKIAKELNIPIIGWHSVDAAGKEYELGLFSNITTDPADVAEIAALLAIRQSKGKANVVIFSDPNYSIASLKANVMYETIQRCTGCNVDSFIFLPLEQTAADMPKIIDTLLNKSQEPITHILVINDLYIDFAIPALENYLDRVETLPTSISAGDGSQASYKRIHNEYFQEATVPEPLILQGWQIVDEFNRAFNQQPPSGYSAPVHLVTKDNVEALLENKEVYDPGNGYRDAYLKIWAGD
jgi:ribose transport system substrate-binding protein